MNDALNGKPQAGKEPLRLLIVDDDPSLCKSLKDFFQTQNRYRVEVVHDGAEVIAKTGEFMPHLMFLDIGLPGLSGIEILKRVKKDKPGLRVIMITGQNEKEIMDQAFHAGADDYVVKPFTLEHLNGPVMDKLQRHLLMDLETEQRNFQQLFYLMKDGALRLDSQWKVLLANPKAAAFLNFSTELSGLPLTQAVQSFHHQPAPKGPKDKIHAPIPVSQIDWKKLLGENFDLVRSAPTSLTLECVLTPVLNAYKTPDGYLLLLRDVTDVRKTTTMMKRFINFIGHKFRTPLVMIKSIPPILMNRCFSESVTEQQKKYLETILQNSLLLQDWVEDVIAYSSLQPDEMKVENVLLSTVVEKAKQLLKDERPENLACVLCDRQLSQMHVQADLRCLAWAFSHLIENAFKFKAKEVRISAEKSYSGRTIIRFSDDGRGIPLEEHERIFDPFEQADKQFTGNTPGAGVGLSITKEIVEAHGGVIRVERSASDKGTIFAIEWPALPK